MSLYGKSVVVTGASGGLGRSIALGCAERGAHVTIGDIDDGAITAAGSALSGFGHGVLARRCDLRIEGDVASLMEAAASTHGGIDYLVNAAGGAADEQQRSTWPPVSEVDEALWRATFDTVDRGTFLCAKHAIPYMERNGSGRIVNVHRGQGRRIPPENIADAMSQSVLVVFTRYLAEQVRAHNICVMAIGTDGGGGTGGTEIADDTFYLAADAGMELSGHVVDVEDGRLVAIDGELDHETLVRSSPQALARGVFPR
jgi:NAD(P)-dependent dehydrogenase (short-subunit alcohol dehydrogenase family)